MAYPPSKKAKKQTSKKKQQKTQQKNNMSANYPLETGGPNMACDPKYGSQVTATNSIEWFLSYQSLSTQSSLE